MPPLISRSLSLCLWLLRADASSIRLQRRGLCAFRTSPDYAGRQSLYRRSRNCSPDTRRNRWRPHIPDIHSDSGNSELGSETPSRGRGQSRCRGFPLSGLADWRESIEQIGGMGRACRRCLQPSSFPRHTNSDSPSDLAVCLWCRKRMCSCIPSKDLPGRLCRRAHTTALCRIRHPIPSRHLQRRRSLRPPLSQDSIC